MGPPVTDGPAPTRRRRTAWRVALAVLVLLAIVVLSHPWWLAASLGAYLERASGRPVHFDTVRLGLSPSFEPLVSMHGVRIGNAPWAGTGRPFASLGEATFHFAWRRVEGRWVVTRLVMSDGDVELIRQPDGHRNWRLRDPDDTGPGHFWFREIEPHHATLRFVHPAVGLALRTTATDAPSPAGDGPGQRIDFDGALRGLAFRGSAFTGPVLTFMQTGRWFALRGHAEIEGAALDVDGRIADMFRATQIDARIVLDGRSLAGLHPFVGTRYSEPRPFHGEGRLHAEAGRYALSDARLQVGKTDLAGDASWSRHGERRTIDAQLRSATTELADLLWAAGHTPPGAVREARAATSEAAHGSARDALAPLRELDAAIRFDARRFVAPTVPALQSVRFAATLSKQALAVSDLDIGWAGGHSTGTLGVDLAVQPPVAQASLRTAGVRVETFFARQPVDRRITGALGGRIELQASGVDVDAMRASLRGTADLVLSDGSIPSLLDAQMGLEGGKLMRTLLSGSEALPLPCAAAAIELGQGRARIRHLVVESANTRTTGQGTIGLGDAAIDLVLTPEPKRPGLLELRKSIRVSGHLPRPSKALVDRVEPPAAAGAACGGSAAARP